MAEKKKVGVTVVGGGIAGITAALRLAQRGYDVTLYEEQEVLGGNLGAFRLEGLIGLGPGGEGGVWRDVYPHLFSNFYHNFWRIVEEDLGWVREQHFEARDSIKIVREDGTYVRLTDGATVRKAWENLWDGILPPADMFLWVYSMLDLMSTPLDRANLADEYSVNGFVGSRPYATARAASLHDFILMVIWSAHSYGVPAKAYKDFFRFTLRSPSPLTWVLRGELHTHLIDPLEKKLEEHGVTVVVGHKVKRILVHPLSRRIDEIWVQNVGQMKMDGKTPTDSADPADYECVEEDYCEKVDVENLILAVNPQAAGQLAQTGKTGTLLVEHIPALSETRRAAAEPIAVLLLQFDRKVPDIPPEHVSLWGSRMHLTFLDLSQVWSELMGKNTVLVVAASNYYGLPCEATPEEGEGAQIDKTVMLDALRSVLPQIEDDDIDLERIKLQTVDANKLFVNTVDSETWRPEPHYEAVPNLFMAGDYCYNPVGLATVEGAVTTGLQAAQALHERTPLGPPVEIVEHEEYPLPAINAMKLAMMPTAYQAKWWSTMSDVVQDAAKGRLPAKGRQDLASLWALPMQFAADFWKTSSELYGSSWEYFTGPR